MVLRALLILLTRADSAQARRPRTPLENTYKMKPDKKFEVAPVAALINDVLKKQVCALTVAAAALLCRGRC